MFDWRHHSLATLRLAGPVMVSRAGILLMVVADTAMSGLAGAEQIAAYGIGAAPLIPMMLLAIGWLLGVQILTAQADGAGQSEQGGTIWLVGIVYAVSLGCAFTVMTQFADFWLALFGQTPELIKEAAPVMQMLGFGMPAMLVYTVTNLFLEAIHRPVAGMVIMLLANLVNVALNWVFVIGVGGVEGMGAEGAALATSIVRWLMAFGALGYLFFCVDRARFGLSPFTGGFARIARRIGRIGWPMALGVGLESTAFATVTLMAGVLGATAVSAYTIAHNFNALIFMFALGVSTAAAVRVGNAIGRRDPAGVRHAGWVAVTIGVVILVFLGLVLLVFRAEAVGLYTDDLEVTLLTVAIMPIVVFLLVPDGLQVIVIGALRGGNDFWSGAFAQLVGFWVVMVPMGWYFGLHLGYGVSMLLWAVCVGAAVSSAISIWRFVALGKKVDRMLEDKPGLSDAGRP